MADTEQTTQEMAARMIANDIQGMAKTIRNISGTPYGVAKLTPNDELWAWGYQDNTIDVDGLRAQGVSDPEIASQRFPLQKHLMEQAGLTTQEQHAYADRMTQRWMRARDAGTLPTAPSRKKLGIGGV